MKEVEHLTDASSHLLGEDFDPSKKRARTKPSRVIFCLISLSAYVHIVILDMWTLCQNSFNMLTHCGDTEFLCLRSTLRPISLREVRRMKKKRRKRKRSQSLGKCVSMFGSLRNSNICIAQACQEGSVSR